MGTRSITTVKDKDGNKIIEMYKQFDGYPDGLGQELNDFINSGKMVNGIGRDNKVFNGISCFAAALVEHLKDGPGGIYLHAPSNNSFTAKDYADKYGIDYYYNIDSDLKLSGWQAWSNDKLYNPTIDNQE